MPIETLKTNYPASTPHFVSGETLNRYNNAINALTRGKTGLHAAGVKVDLPPVPFIFGIAEITDASNACPQADYEQGSDAPCFSQNRYLARFRYYNFDDQEWVEIEEDLRLDASGWFEPVVTDAGPASSGPGYGAIPTFVKGDVINAYFDVNRNWLIPVCTPPADPPMGEFYTDDRQTIDENPDVSGAVVLEAYLEVFRPGIDEDFFPVAGVSFPMMSVGGGTTFDSRCTFTNIACTSGTQVRVRATRGPHETTGANVQVAFSTIKFTGTGRRNSQAVSDPPTYPAYEGGKTILGWQASASTQGRYKDSPTFVAVDALNAFRVGYFDPLDQWIVGIELFVLIKVVEGDENSSSSSPSSLSSTSSSTTSTSSTSSLSSLSSQSSLSSSSSTTSQSSQSSSLSSSSTSSSSVSSSSSQSLSTSSQTMSTSSSSQSVSESSSSSADCVRFVENVCFDTVTCTLTVTWGEFCIPRGSGITVSHDVEGPPC